MRILQLCNKAPYPANDGSSIAICNLAEGLANNGVDIYLLAVNTKKHFKPDENIPAEFVLKTHYQSVYKNTDTTFFGAVSNLFSSESYFVSRFFFIEYEQALQAILTQHTFDVIQIEGVFMASYIPLLKKYSKAKIVLRTHNIEHQIWNRHLSSERNIIKKTYLALQNKRLKKFEINAIKLVDAVVTITDEDKQGIQKIDSTKKVHTCLTGINLQTYSLVAQPSQPNTVFHFASMDWMPNIEAVDWLLNGVWQEVVKTIPNAKLILAGRGMPEKFKNNQLESVTIVENVDNSKTFYQTYDIMLVPLWSGSGLRIKLVEGLAYGKAIVTTSIGAEGIPYTHNHDVMIADTKKTFADAIVSLLTDNLKKQNLQAHARQLAETTFDYSILAKELILFYNTETV
jgi:polysaccharide biosynthesis protein PslH